MSRPQPQGQKEGQRRKVARNACKIKNPPDKLFTRAEKSILGTAKEEVKQDDVIECYNVKVSCKHKKPGDKELQVNTGYKYGVKKGKCSCNTSTKFQSQKGSLNFHKMIAQEEIKVKRVSSSVKLLKDDLFDVEGSEKGISPCDICEKCFMKNWILKSRDGDLHEQDWVEVSPQFEAVKGHFIIFF